MDYKRYKFYKKLYKSIKVGGVENNYYNKIKDKNYKMYNKMDIIKSILDKNEKIKNILLDIDVTPEHLTYLNSIDKQFLKDFIMYKLLEKNIDEATKNEIDTILNKNSIDEIDLIRLKRYYNL
jgi:hypothetical protein